MHMYTHTCMPTRTDYESVVYVHCYMHPYTTHSTRTHVQVHRYADTHTHTS